VTADRLTRNELTWLLTQEARSAAQKLRQGVGIAPAGAEAALPPVTIMDEGSGGVERTLDQLDEAVSRLASLHGHAAPRGRRGKIDLAALLWEVAPEARVQIEMGEGTTVFGDEAELKRMLFVLLGQGGDPTSSGGSPNVTIRREGDEIRVGVNLGPDTPATFEAERGWLARMAIRHGGRLELDGSMQTLVFAADVDTHRREMESLKKELAAAQAQGEAYARELAAVFTREASHSSIPVAIPAAPPLPGGLVPRTSRMPPSGEGLSVLVAAARVLGADLRGILSAIGRDIVPLRERSGEVGEIAASVGRHVTGASELVGDLARLGACPIGELGRQADVSELLREVVQGELARASRHELKLVVDAPESLEDLVPVATLSVLFQVLLDHAIDASAPGTEVRIRASDEAGMTVITFDDTGAALPPAAKAGVLSRDFEAIAPGRPRALSLIAAQSIAAHLHLVLDLEPSPSGGTRVRLGLPRSGE
jgi:two-component system OmpR family sensor kinase